jgi:hypothetical protein
MLDLPERIWVWKSHDGTFHVANLLPIQQTDTQYIRADLSPATIPTIGELVDQWREEEGFSTFWNDHRAVFRNLEKWLTARLKGATT